MKQVKKSGLLSGGGLGFTIGKEKQKDQYASQNTEQVGITIGSVEGNVTITSDKNAAVKASDVIARKDIHITGENVDITSKDSIYNYQEKHEYERTGLSVSLGGAVIETAQTVIQPLERARKVEGKRLSALYGIKAGQEYKNGKQDLDLASKQYTKAASDYTQAKEKLQKLSDKLDKNIVVSQDEIDKAKKELATAKENAQKARDNLVNLHIGIGSEKSQTETRSTTAVAEGSTVKAKGDVTITSIKEDITIHGSSVEGENVTLNAAKDLNATASENTNKTKEDHTASSGSIGVTVGLGGVMGVDAGYSQGKENIKENSTTYNESTVKAKKDLTFESGKDTNIRGGALSGEKVTGKVGGNLNIESKKDSKDYESKSSSAGLGLSYNPTGGVSVTGGASKGNIESQYNSVTSQSGIYAGKEGFDISVEKNTDLKGAVIGSQASAEKNQLTTGTLTWEDTKNKAEYEAGGVGINVNTSSGVPLNEQGITPSITPTAKGDVNSTTKSAVAEGTITIKDKGNQKQNVAELNRYTENTLNGLREIFDKDDIKEKQEFIGMVTQNANNIIHDISEVNNWKDGSEEKFLMHTIVGEIIGQLSGGNFADGAMVGGINEYIMGKIIKLKGYEYITEHPDVIQWIGIALGGVISKTAGENEKIGSAIAGGSIKWNLEEGYDIYLRVLEGKRADNIKEQLGYSKDKLLNLGDVILEYTDAKDIRFLSGASKWISAADLVYTLHNGDIYDKTIALATLEAQYLGGPVASGIVYEYLNYKKNQLGTPEGRREAIREALEQVPDSERLKAILDV